MNRILYGIVWMLLFNPGLVADEFAGGSGTEDDPWQVENPDHLDAVRDHLSAHFLQIADIDAEDTENWNEGAGFLPIGEGFDAPFQGSFNGDGFTISSLTINLPDTDYVGLFASTEDALLENIHLVAVNITGKARVGGLTGYNYESLIHNCSSSGFVTGHGRVGGLVGSAYFSTITDSSSGGSVQGSSMRVGGLVGINDFYSSISNSHSTANVISTSFNVGGLAGESLSPISNSYSSGNVSGSSRVGGLVGSVFITGISNSYSTGDVSCSNFLAGGLVGDHETSTIINCYSTGNVSGNTEVGGLAGRNDDDAIILNSFSTGFVDGNENVGGLVGENRNSTVTNSYWDEETSGQSESDGGESRSTEEMTFPYSPDTFTDWDFGIHWSADTDYSFNDGYPYFSDEKFLVTFKVTNQFNDHIEGAVLRFTGMPTAFSSDAEGQVVLEMPAGTYSYRAEKEDHQQVEDDLIVEDQDIIEEVILIVDDTSVAEKQGMEVVVYPVPASEVINVDSGEMIQQLYLYDLKGNPVKHKDILGTNTSLHMQGLDAGIYFLIVITDESEQTIRIVKNR